jgi:hypothetical protein
VHEGDVMGHTVKRNLSKQQYFEQGALLTKKPFSFSIRTNISDLNKPKLSELTKQSYAMDSVAGFEA